MLGGTLKGWAVTICAFHPVWVQHTASLVHLCPEPSHEDISVAGTSYLRLLSEFLLMPYRFLTGIRAPCLTQYTKDRVELILVSPLTGKERKNHHGWGEGTERPWADIDVWSLLLCQMSMLTAPGLSLPWPLIPCGHYCVTAGQWV